jgi:hypothetical protein
MATNTSRLTIQLSTGDITGIFEPALDPDQQIAIDKDAQHVSEESAAVRMLTRAADQYRCKVAIEKAGK